MKTPYSRFEHNIDRREMGDYYYPRETFSYDDQYARRQFSSRDPFFDRNYHQQDQRPVGRYNVDVQNRFDVLGN